MALVSDGGIDKQPTVVGTSRLSVSNEALTGATDVYKDITYLVLETVGISAAIVQEGAAVANLGIQALQQVALFEHHEAVTGATDVDSTTIYIALEAITPFPNEQIHSPPEAALAAPTLSSIDPTSGVVTGGYGFTILGANFVAGATVSFGANPATGLSVAAGQITGTVPAGTEGGVTVTVTNPDTQFVTTSFTYTAVPEVPSFFELSPDLGLLDFNSHFSPSANGLLIQIDQGGLVVVSGSEGDPTAKGLGAFRITLGGILYEVPLSARRRLRTRNGGRIIWRSTTGESGTFRFFHMAPPVFEEEGVLT